MIGTRRGDAGPNLTQRCAPCCNRPSDNIEVLVVGEAVGNATQAEDFASYRGLFFEPSLSHLDILRDSRADRLWRGSHLMFARAGTVFDTDTFALLNAALRPETAA